METYPVIVFCYKRLEHLKLTISHLKQNYLAPQTDLYIFSDAAKVSSEESLIQQLRAFLSDIDGFKTVSIIKAAQNKGLAKSIIDGVGIVLRKHEAAIVLEDDLLTSPNFLDYMNHSLNFYKNNSKVFSISGYSFPVRVNEDYPYDNYFTLRGSSWGWATWRNRWETIDWNVSDFAKFSKDKAAQKEFNRMGSDLSGMLAKQMEGKISSWAIRWCYHQFKTNTFTSFPVRSKIQNIGFDSAATHTSGVMASRFTTILDTSAQRTFSLDKEAGLNPTIIKQFINRYSILTRLKYKAMGYIFK